MTLIQLPASTTFELDDGGDIHLDEDVAVPADVYPLDTGVAFGPLMIATPPDGIVSIKHLDFVPHQEDDGWFPVFDDDAESESEDDGGFFDGLFGDEDGSENETATPTAASVIAIGAATQHRESGQSDAAPDARGRARPSDDFRVTRRAALSLAACILTGAAIQPVVAQDDPVEYRIAELEFQGVTEPTIIRVADVVEHVLPHSTEIYVDTDGSREREIDDPEDGAFIPPGTSEATVYLKDELGNVDRLQSWARGLTAGSHDVEYHLELEQPLGSYEQGDRVVIATHPAIVDPVREGGGDETIVVVGDDAASVPHRDEHAGKDVGEYFVDGERDALVLEVGREMPDTRTVTLRLAAGNIATTVDGARRAAGR